MAIGRRILFVENRYRTYFWEEMANRLEKDGHEIYFIVENHAFVPKRKNVYVIPYPVRKNLNEINSRIEFEKIKALLSNDRIKWREYKNRHIIGYDLNYDVTIKIEGHSSDNMVIVVLSTEK